MSFSVYWVLPVRARVVVIAWALSSARMAADLCWFSVPFLCPLMRAKR
jgi:hypothetical protein